MASREKNITQYLFPPYDKHFRDTYSSPVVYTDVRLRQHHTQARSPVPVHFCWLLFSVATQKFPLPVVKSTLQAQWVNSSTDNAHRASVVKKSKVFVFTHMPKRSSFVSHKKFSACSSSTVFISGHWPLRRTVDCTTDNKQHLVSSMEHVPRGIFALLCNPPQSRWCL